MIRLSLSPEDYQQLVADVAAEVEKRQSSSVGHQVKATYSVAEVAKIIGVCKDTINRRIKAGEIHKVPAVSPARISNNELQRLLGGADDAR